MCGRISQAGDLAEYVETIRWTPYSILEDPVGPRYNVPPGTRPLVMHRLGGHGHESLDRIFWGYKPAGFKHQPVSNARLAKILDGSGFWTPLFKRGRIIVPADGWYEWTGEKANKQPWYIYPKDGRPIFMAAITAWAPGYEMDAMHGFAIVTDDSAGGMVDIHDRRPIALTPDDALEWLGPATSEDQAKDILSTARPESAFIWYQVTRAMGNARYQQPDATAPINT